MMDWFRGVVRDIEAVRDDIAVGGEDAVDTS